MSAWSVHRRIAGGVIAALALTLAPVVTLSASAIPTPPEPPTALRIDLSAAQVSGSLKVTWNDSPTTDVSEYRITWTYENGVSDDGFVDHLADNTFTVPDLFPNESVDIKIEAFRTGVYSTPSVLRATGLGGGINYSFTDTTANTFRYEISWLSTVNVTTGYVAQNGSRFFAPSAPVLREQIAAFLYRLDGYPDIDTSGPSPFSDVPKTATFYKEILWMAQEGISTGYVETNGTTTFRPSQPVLREQFAAFLYRYDEAAFDPDYTTFTDVPLTATFHDQIEWLAFRGISTGYDLGNGEREFRGSQPVLREQTSAFLYRYVNGEYGDGTIILD